MEDVLGKELGHQESSGGSDYEIGEWADVVIQSYLPNMVLSTLREGPVLYFDPRDGLVCVRRVGETVQTKKVSVDGSVP